MIVPLILVDRAGKKTFSHSSVTAAKIYIAWSTGPTVPMPAVMPRASKK